MTLIAAVCNASVIYPEVPLLMAISKAAVVVRAKINRIEPRRFDRNGRSMKCGTEYVIEVLETFKGRKLNQRSFSFTGQPHALLNYTVNVGDEMLLLLTPRKIGERPEGGFPDVIEALPSVAERACLATLSLWTLSLSEAGGFPLVMKPASSTDMEPIKWLGYVRIRTLLPPALRSLQVPFNRDCSGDECESASRRMVPWLPLRTEILRSLGGKPGAPGVEVPFGR